MSSPKPSVFFLTKDKNFVLMWVAMLASTFGTFSLLIVLATELYQLTKSALISGSVFAAQWLVPLFFAFSMAKILRKPQIFYTLGASEAFGAVTSILAGIGIVIGNMPLLFTALVLRGLVESVTKSGRLIALKTYTSRESLEMASSMFNSSYYLGIAAGALLAPFLTEHFSVLVIALIDGSTFVLSSSIYFALAFEKKNSSIALHESVETKRLLMGSNSNGEILTGLFRKRELILTSLLAIINVTLFQGFHNVARTALPLGHFDSGSAGVAIVQTANISGIMAGLFFVGTYLTRRDANLLKLPLFWFVLAGIFLPIPSILAEAYVGYIFYFCFAFCFEVAFVLLQNKIVLSATKDELSLLSLVNQSAMSGGMALCVLVAGFAVDSFGLRNVSFAISVFSILVAAGIFFCERMSLLNSRRLCSERGAKKC